MWVKLPLCLGWNSLPAGLRWDVGRVGGIELCFPPNSMVPCEPALQLSMWISFPMWVCWIKLRCGQECTRWIFTGRRKSPKASPRMKILATMELGGLEKGSPCCPSPPHTLLVLPVTFPTLPAAGPTLLCLFRGLCSLPGRLGPNSPMRLDMG